MAFKMLAAVLAVVMLTATLKVQAADPELLTDFYVPEDQELSDINATFFFSDVLKQQFLAGGNANSPFATVTTANVNNFQALNGLGTSTALLQFPAGTINRPHTHPRGTEILFIMDGCLEVGLLESTIPPNGGNRLFTKTLYKGDLFVFPRGLVHFQINLAKDGKEVTAVAAFSSASPGLIVLPQNLFGSNPRIDIDILATAFQVSPEVIKKLVAAQQ